MKTVVMYHSHCFDGSMAAAAALKAIAAGRLDCDREGLIPITYKESTHGEFFSESPLSPFSKAQELSAEQYIFVDFCPKPEVVTGLLEMGLSVVILDHHKTARDDAEKLKGLDGLDLNFDMTKSGSRMAWEYFRKGGREEGHIPKLALHVEDRDLWTWAIPNTREAIAWLSAEAPTNDPEAFFKAALVFEENPSAFISIGSYICREMDSQIKKISSSFRYLEIQGYGRGIVVNASCYTSEVCEYLYNRYEVPFVIAYHSTRSGDVALSFRSKKGGAVAIDVSELAKQFNGGGHPSASGGVSDLERWVDYLHGSSDQ